FVVATGESRTVREFVDKAFRHVGLDWEKYVVIDRSLYRPAEVHTLCGDPGFARKKLKWEPVVTFDELVKMMVDADLKWLSESTGAEKA
ncbi:MAG: GDP-mannose 4,6-dehydratase, partial [Candidatus Omnitrophica bacterium]|nr:GDP-mannose 4,6-dehydratase [Candidatus Omnitrophota bacterium]